MALHTLKDWAKMCGRDLAAISQDASVKRGKIKVDANKMVNDKLQANADYLAKWLSKKPDNGSDIHIVPRETNSGSQTPPETASKPPKSSKSSGLEGGDEGMYALEKLNKKLDAEKKVVDIAIQEIKKEKLLGLLVPGHIIRPLFEIQRETQKTATVDLIEEFIMILSAVKELTAEEKVDIRKKCLEKINAAIDKSVDDAHIAVSNLIAEFSESRGVGERK